MQWENLTSPDFAHAVNETGLCVLALGVLERHSDHLPLGTDFLNAHSIACLAAEQEPAVVFPPFYFGQIYEARTFPGALTLPPTLLLQVLQTTLDEIGRNGFHKIVLFNGHGGNNAMLRFLAQCSLAEEKPYHVYLFEGPGYRMTADQQQLWEATLETKNHGHACECETSITLAGFPDLVHMERVPSQPALPRGRLTHLPGNFSGISWYADYPEHYAGDARTATAEKGRILRGIQVQSLAKFLGAVKADSSLPALDQEFFSSPRSI